MSRTLRAEWTKQRTAGGTGWLLLAVVVLTTAVSAAAAGSVTCHGLAGPPLSLGNGADLRAAARDTRASTRRTRRQAAIRSVIVTLTPWPCWRCSANWTARRGSRRRCYRHPKFEHHNARHEPTLIAAARSQMTASSPRGAFSQAELVGDRVITRYITRCRWSR
jgi:hypothetical protein